MSKCQFFPRSFQFWLQFWSISTFFWNTMYTKTKKNKTPIKPPTKIGRSNENRPLKEGVKYYFTDLCLKNYGNLRKVRRFDPRQIQTVSKMVQSRPKDASKLNPTCCKDVPKSSQSFYSKYSYKHKAYLAVSNFYSRAQQRQIQRQTH